MLDVHLPHKGIRGFSEFLVHLFTITVGLLIAVQIESFVEWRHHLHLAEEARVALRAEIQHNLGELKAAQSGLKAWREQIDADFKVMQRIQENPNDSKAQHSALSVNYSFITLSDTAWRTAQSTGALAYMPYEEAEQYSSIYQTQASLLALQSKPTEDAVGIIGLTARYNFHSSPSSRLTVEQAGALAEKFNQMRTHLMNGNLVLRESMELNQAFLENRKPSGDFTEQLH
jgi:ribosomal protein RSM22 (predicted rRNA methylase)